MKMKRKQWENEDLNKLDSGHDCVHEEFGEPFKKYNISINNITFKKYHL